MDKRGRQGKQQVKQKVKEVEKQAQKKHYAKEEEKEYPSPLLRLCSGVELVFISLFESITNSPPPHTHTPNKPHLSLPPILPPILLPHRFTDAPALLLLLLLLLLAAATEEVGGLNPAIKVLNEGYLGTHPPNAALDLDVS